MKAQWHMGLLVLFRVKQQHGTGTMLSLIWASAVLTCMLPAATELIRVLSTTAELNDPVATSRLALTRPAL